ncbi:MAG: hypothetical protein HY861_05210 [Chlamydiia bacterium]|nr:hypothetical protein [Chlamydiia bacterium]
MTADFLWWKGAEDDFSLGFVQTVDFATSTTTAHGVDAYGDIVSLDYKWMPGFRAGLGFLTSYDSWDVLLSYTWYQGHASKSFSSSTNGGLGIENFWQSKVVSAADQQYGSSQGSWKLQYNMFDLEMGRDFLVSCGLSLRPSLGVEGGWVNRIWSTSWGDADPASASGLVANGSYVNQSNYWGAGPKLGLNTTWKPDWQGFHFFGNFGGSILSGKVFKNSATITSSSTLAAPTLLSSESKIQHKDVWKMVPHLQYIAGLGWGKCFNCNKVYMGLRVGYEVNYFWNIPQTIYPVVIFSLDDVPNFVVGSPNRSNRSRSLGLSGLTVDAKIEF